MHFLLLYVSALMYIKNVCPAKAACRKTSYLLVCLIEQASE